MQVPGSEREELVKRIERGTLVPVVRAPSADLAVKAVEAILEGGISTFEITLTVPGAVQVIESLVKRFGSRALIGAGTVLSAEQAAACIDVGAQFVVSPGFDAATVELVLKRGLPCMPGALTPTEVITAWKAGADMVKIFPCSAMGGAKYLKALKGPLPQVKMLPTGGVNATTVHEYLAAGAAALGIGSELVDAQALAAGNLDLITARARELVDAVAASRALR
ncbi:MAG TPA: bifunctional 4-hydroxy-2-oxoglutarate aldolase/2-dehydro-3-deoxy-phosphogluconate aldolase [Polyangiaceae bacterium]|nr:bifunctional 4-hydroxy-2-oxoglutarate aldolase/2-dehydro-3-deoxy-phosphogluconate aldolase [Polyangiaceae bacterium]